MDKNIKAQDVRNRWCTRPVDGDNYSKLLKEYRDYLHSDECDSNMIRTDVIAVIYKNLIDKFCRLLGLS